MRDVYFWACKDKLLFKVAKNANVQHLDVGVKRKFARIDSKTTPYGFAHTYIAYIKEASFGVPSERHCEIQGIIMTIARNSAHKLLS